jgi:DNA-binding transcriptional regulator YiaG
MKKKATIVVGAAQSRHLELSPEDIRRIRESLSLSQVEAGELVGGGPRAFAKYEAGTIRPAASVVNLLRLLEANPSALSTLTGRKMVPIENDGSRPFKVSGDHIAALSARRLVNLVKRLLSAESQSGLLPMDRVHVAANITAPDAGEDARVEWDGGPKRTAYLPRRLCQFQLKASGMTPAEAAADVLTSAGQVQPMIKGALAAGGIYIMMSARSYTKKEIGKREDRIRKALAGAGLAINAEQVQFRDASQIADWVNAHPPVAAWVLEQTQPGLTGPFRDWAHWAGRHEHDSSPLVDDARLAPVTERLRALVAPPRGVARVVGLSGVGKSRLVLEALGPTGDEEASGPSLSDLVLYAVESESGSTAVKNTVQNLADSSLRALVVVDRCEAETHQDLAAMVKRSSSRLSLVTIDHEIPADLDAASDDVLAKEAEEGLILVKKAEGGVIDGLLKRVAPNLPSEDHSRLLKFADGFPQLAILIGQSWVRDEPIASATDEALIDSVIFGRNPSDRPLLRDAGMLLGAFGLLGAKQELAGDLAEAVKLSRGRTADELRAALDWLYARGVAQWRGRLIALQPRPVALALAERKWRQWSPEQWDDVLAGSLPQHLRIRAADQLALLNTKSIAKEVAEHLCRHNGPLASLEGLAQPGNAEVLVSLAEIDTDAVVNVLERVLGPLTTAQLRSIEDDFRRNLVRALERVAFVSGTFEQGANLLLDLAVAENETWGNNATGQFTRLFPIFLADTEAGPELRLRFLDDRIITATEPEKLAILVDALLAGARTSSFSRSVGSEVHGSRPALKPWHPKIWKDAWDYIMECCDRLASLATRPDGIGQRARSGLGREFRALAAPPLIDRVENVVEQVIAAHTYWPEALETFGNVLQYDADALDPDVERRVRALITKLTPNTFASRVRFLVTEMPWDYPVDEKIDFEERGKLQQEAVEALVGELLNDKDGPAPFLPQLSGGDQRMTSVFGKALAKQSADPLVWREPIMGAVAGVPPKERNFSLLAGYFAGLNERDPMAVEVFKQKASSSPVFAPALPLVCWVMGIKDSDVPLVCAALAAGLIPPFMMAQWQLGGVLAKLPPRAAAPLFDQMLKMGDRAYSIGLTLIVMYVHGQRDHLDALRPQLRLAAELAAEVPKRLGQNMDVHHFGELMQWLLAKGRGDDDARAVVVGLAKQLAADPGGGGSDLIKPLMPRLLSDFPESVWPIIGQAIVSDRTKAWRIEHALGDRYSFGTEQRPSILRLPEDFLFSWCHAHPEQAPAFVASVAPVLTNRDPNMGHHEFHPLVRRLLDEFGDRENVLNELAANMHSFGWTGSRTTYYALYEQPLQALESHLIGAVRRWAKKMLAGFRRAIKDARNQDEERDASWGL